jgi:preprotein translocase subunit SecG
MSSFLFYLSLSLFLFICVFLILLILIQKGRGGGLSSAFGGGGGSAAFGAKTGDVLTWATSGFFFAFIGLAVALNWVVDYQTRLAPPPNVPVSSVPASPAIPTNTPPPIIPGS